MSLHSEHPFTDKLSLIADDMGVGMYQRFTVQEASIFLRCTIPTLKQLVQDESVICLQLPDENIEFFGYQLLEYLLSSVSGGEIPAPQTSTPDKIIRVDDVIEMTGLSRSTLHRWEREGKFPNRVPLGANSVGWRLSEINQWIQSR